MQEKIILPPPNLKGLVSVEESINRRRSHRNLSDQPVSLETLSQLLWSAQGITESSRHLRAVPSAGSTFPLEIFIVAGSFGVGGLAAGLYVYSPADHTLSPLRNGDFRQGLANEALGQQAITNAPVTLVITADYERTRERYRNRTERYVHMEAGHAAQNVHLQAAALGLGTVAIGAFDDSGVAAVLGLAANYAPLYVMPVGSIV